MGLKAPPATLITRYEEAFFVLLPIPSKPKAKMVGNMIDMKKKEQYRERMGKRNRRTNGF